MAYENKCTTCYGTGKLPRRDRQSKRWFEVTCGRCRGTGRQEKAYRVMPTYSDAKGLGFDPINSWPPVGEKGKCCVCSKPLTGRQRRFCGDDNCKQAIWARLYNGVHWTKRHICVRDGSACRACGEVFESPIMEGGPAYPSPSELELDHIHPLHLGGTDHADNLQLLCPKCHKKKSAAEATARATNA